MILFFNDDLWLKQFGTRIILNYSDLHRRSSCLEVLFNPLSANPIKWPNTLKQFVGKLPTNCLSVLGHFVNLALKGLKKVLLKVLQNLQENTCAIVSFLIKLQVSEKFLRTPFIIEQLHWLLLPLNKNCSWKDLIHAS